MKPNVNNKSIRFYYANARSLKSADKRKYLEHLISTDPFSAHTIYIFTETWLTGDFSDSIFQFNNNFNVFRNDRPYGQKGGGILILVPISINSRIVPELTYNADQNNYQSLSIIISVNSTNYTVSGIYRRPVVFNDVISTAFISLFQNICSNTNDYIIAGDFNYPTIDWETLKCATNTGPIINFLRQISDCGCVQVVDFATHIHPRGNFSNCLDLIFLSDINLLNIVKSAEPFGTGSCVTSEPSDHLAINFVSTIENNCKTKPYTFRNFTKADWNRINFELWSINWDAFFEFCPTPDMMVLKLTELLNRLIASHVPQFRKTQNRFIPLNCPSLSRYRAVERRLSKKLKSSIDNDHKSVKFNQANLYLSIRRLRAKIRRLTKISPTNRQLAVLKSRNIKKFWNSVNSKTKLSNNIPILVDKLGNEIVSDQRKANLFSELFSTPLVPPHNLLTPISSLHSKPLRLDFSPRNVMQKLKGLPNNRATGLDGIPNCFLKNCHAELAKPLSKIFYVSYFTGTFPSKWKIGKVTPIHKKKCKNNPDNYRPICLNATMSKVFEKIVREHILEFCQNNNLLSANQFGFLPNKSVETQLLKCCNDWTKAYERSIRTDVLYLDLTKAFDRVSHAILLSKLQKMRFPSHFLAFITSYLSNRSQLVEINGTKSLAKPVTVGVPQGSVLGPLLFVLFVNDLPKVVKSSKILLYADDIKLYKQIQLDTDLTLFQTDIDAVASWLDQNQLELSAGKSGILKIGEKFSPIPVQYSINDSAISNFDQFQDLGVFIDKSLDFDKHISYVHSRSVRTYKCMYHNFLSPDILFRLQMHKTFVLPIAESFSSIWSPYQLGHIRKIESCQLRFTSKLYNDSHTVPYENRCNTLGLKPLIHRRLICDLTMLHKLIHGKLPGLDSSDFLTLTTTGLRGHKFKIFKEQLRTQPRKNFLVNRIAGLWNLLPADLVNSSSTQSFKSGLRLAECNNIIVAHINRIFPHLFS